MWWRAIVTIARRPGIIMATVIAIRAVIIVIAAVLRHPAAATASCGYAGKVCPPTLKISPIPPPGNGLFVLHRECLGCRLFPFW